MELILLSSEQKKRYRADIMAMMVAGDNDFVPPLSTRFSPKQTCFGTTPQERGIETYLDGMLNEQVLGAFEGDTLLGFVTFVEDLQSPHFGADPLPNIYLCTLLVKPEARGKHLTRTMYEHLFFERYPTHHIFTRTWSTNAAHIAILGKFGFELIARLENDRGEGLDTVYFGLRRA